MTSDSNDLEDALRENLKLRSELEANVTKAEAANQRDGMAYRSGWVLYWACIVLAVFWMLGLFLYVGEGSVTNALDLLVRRLRQDPLNAPDMGGRNVASDGPIRPRSSLPLSPVWGLSDQRRPLRASQAI